MPKQVIVQLAAVLFTVNAASANILNLQFAGSGEGSINSVPSGISCTANSSFSVAAATTVTLKATPDGNSVFKGWQGACSGAGDCTVTLAPSLPIATVKANFDALRPVRVNPAQPSYYRSFADAYRALREGGVLHIQARSIGFDESPVFARNLQVRLDGGYNGSYGAKDGVSTINGTVQVRSGKLIASRVAIRGAFKPNSRPLALIQSAQPAGASHVSLDGSGSYDADGDRLGYSWTLISTPGGSSAALSDAASAAPRFTPDVAGDYTVALVVSDGKSASEKSTVTVTPNVAPVARTAAGRNAVLGDLVKLDGRGSSDANGDPLSYRWQIAARPAGSSATLSAPTSPTPAFTADRAGNYTLTLTVNDGKVDSAPAGVTVSASLTPAVAADRKFFLTRNGSGSPVFLKGVNIGASMPGHFPGELAIAQSDYLRWFRQIYDMGANTVRVFTTLPPAFYDALHEFNRDKDRSPLYFMQGVWVNEEDIALYREAFGGDGKILNDFLADAKKLVDVIHGNAVLPPSPGHASGAYTRDVARYMAGWILGIEWEPRFVLRTNAAHAGMGDYDGSYLRTVGAQPFEIFLATVGDQVIGYERESYGTERPLSFVNWVTTDTITHDNEPLADEDIASVDTEKIHAKPSFGSGLFASYNVYPYYPDMFSYQREYIDFVDETGKRNPYRAYLRDLIARHSQPVLITEFGIPSSRGKAHDNLVMGFNQGFADETTQGEQLASMLDDIRGEGYVGGLVFSWQDEWFKRTWNTMDFDNADMRPYWSNAQTNEQQFGLLSFDPGTEPLVRLDGKGSEWPQEAPVSSQGDRRLYMLSDERYLYFMVRDLSRPLTGEKVVLPVDVNPASGSTGYGPYAFAAPADFVVTIDGSNSRIVVHSYYDAYYYLYGERLNLIPRHPEYLTRDNPYFNPMMLPTSKRLYLPVDQVTVPFTAYETGMLKNGIGDPDHSAYNSLSDWYADGDTLEIRIPWQLLNFRAPSIGEIMGDIYLRDDIYPNGGLRGTTVAEIKAGVGSGAAGETIAMGTFDLKKWDLPTYHERLKKSYYIMKDKFRSIP